MIIKQVFDKWRTFSIFYFAHSFVINNPAVFGKHRLSQTVVIAVFLITYIFDIVNWL